MRNIRQAITGVLAALLSVAVILGSLSLSLSESGLKLALQSTPTRTRRPRLSTLTPTALPATVHPGETSTTSLFTPTSTETLALMIPLDAIPSPTPFCTPPEGWFPIEIQLGDTLSSLALQYNTTEENLIQGNCLPTDILLPGTILYVPPGIPTATSFSCQTPVGWVFYTVQPGDTLFGIGLIFGVTVEELQIANCMGE